MKVKVKICGIQDMNDANNAIAAGANYLGFIFAKNSNRAINVSIAKDIIKKVKGKTFAVGVFRNNALEEVNSLSKELDFDLVQLHGEEEPEFCKKVIRPVIKTFGLSQDFSVKEAIEKMNTYDVKYYLIDRLEPGEGDRLSHSHSAKVVRKFQTFFAGGLTPDTVANAVREVRPFAVDVISGVKTDGKFDFEKMKQFVINAKGVTL